VKPAPFAYAKAKSLDHAIELLARPDGEARLLAGGQSLIATLNMRLSAPKLLIDLNGIGGLAGIAVKAGEVEIGALTRHAEAERSADIARHAPLIALAMPHIGHAAIRNRGTLGGSIAFADPAAELPACLLALGGEVDIAGPAGRRTVKADDFFKGLFETALAPDEIITKVSFPLAKKAGYEKFRNQASRFALVGVFASKRGSEIRVAVTGAGSNGVFRVPSFEEALKKRFAPKSLEGLTLPATGMNADIHGSAEYRAHLVGVMARRAVARANEGGGEGEGDE
jgi:carbon-monoxide dehydrogenase medium subunit